MFPSVLLISDVPFAKDGRASSSKELAKRAVAITEERRETRVPFDPAVHGRYVRVQLDGHSNFLHLSQVEVLGRRSTRPAYSTTPTPGPVPLAEAEAEQVCASTRLCLIG